MNPSQHAEQFQSQLANYVPQFTPQFWPVWLIIAGLLLVGMWFVLGLHALLRARGVKKSATDHGEKVYLYSKAVRLWHWSNALLFVLLLASGLINHFALVGATAVKSLVAVHEVCGFLLLACWLGFVLINAVAPCFTSSSAFFGSAGALLPLPRRLTGSCGRLFFTNSMARSMYASLPLPFGS